ncbi:hypothetical protein BS47DRAFT_1371905 [Hydnum rufescens UP504]|uniref:PQ loop repeat protein n=1 Tax=Hydnum rufescens UP504 TaxID=1448309 RepID=A0A9P6DYP6_9AGAM|nr:hypothetical protein BS47DRAFT_1371905 [Hydnum rufescens UP504]
MSLPTCSSEHNPVALTLTIGVTFGLIVSYLPQHLRIIFKGSSEGLSPWFLLLGSTSSAAAMLNVVVLQWPVIKCCKEVKTAMCFENLGGVFQVSIQWALFTFTLVLFLIYFPAHLKYTGVRAAIDPPDSKPAFTLYYRDTTSEWKLGVTLAAVVGLHLGFCTLVTFLLITTQQVSPPSPLLSLWATFLGLLSALFSAFQFIPQIRKTWSTKLVGSLSIVTMCIQSPGAVVMCVSIAIRPGTNWTSWATYAAAGMLQSVLLTMCLFWKKRQARLGIDDFGRPLSVDDTDGEVAGPRDDGIDVNGDERTPC